MARPNSHRLVASVRAMQPPHGLVQNVRLDQAESPGSFGKYMNGALNVRPDIPSGGLVLYEKVRVVVYTVDPLRSDIH